MEELDKRSAGPGTAVSAGPRPRSLVLTHWLTLVLLLLAFGAVLLRELVEDKGLRALLLSIHQWSGGTVLALGVTRLLVRWRFGRLPATAAPHWSNGVAGAVHFILYGVLLAVPLLGWASVTASGKVPPWGLRLPGAWLEVNEDLADQLGNWHERAAYAAAIVIALHALAALWHHFVLRDDVLRAMRLRRSPTFRQDPKPPT